MEPPPSPKGTINAHTNISNIFLQDLDNPKRNRDLMIPTLNLDQNFKITIPGENTSDYRESLSDTIDNTPPHYITCYTDGSKLESRFGAGYIITTNNNTIIITKPPTGFLITARYTKHSLPLYGKPATSYSMKQASTS